jgi:hypothetical protein
MDTEALLARALEETHAVERLIERGEWQQAVDHNAARQRLLAEAFGHDPAAIARGMAPHLRAIADEILALNNRLIGLAEHRRRSVERESDVLQLGQRAAAAYHRAGTDR